jgi:hypothetical protein
MKLSIGVLEFLLNKSMLLPFAETIPAVTVEFNPKGFPTARTHCPTSTISEFAKFK